MTARARAAVIAILVLAAAGLRTQNLLAPWVGEHTGWGGAMYGNIARNFLAYGYATTRLGPVASFGAASPDQFEYYYHHPPLLVWLVSISFRLFGVHEWSARLVPLAFSIASLGLAFVLARRLFSDGVAILALAFLAVMPVENYYGSHLDPYGPVAVFFALLAVLAYARWRDSGRAIDLVLCNGAILLGCATSWYAYFLPPLILVHHAVAPPRPGRARGLLLLTTAACAVLAFGAFVAHRAMLPATGNPEVAGSLLEKLAARTSYSRIGFRGERLSVAAFLAHHARDLARMISPGLLALAAVWCLLSLRDALRRRFTAADGIVGVLLGYGALHTAAFPSAVSGHDYLAACYAAGIAIASAIVVVRAHAALAARWGRAAARSAAGVLVALAVVAGVALTERCYWWDRGTIEEARRAREWGAIVRRETAATDAVLVPEGYDLVRAYYAERKVVYGIDSAEKLAAARAETRAGAVFVCASTEALRFEAMLDGAGPRGARRDAGALAIYPIPPR